MYKWIQKNNKRLLAVIGVFLMVAFLAPSTFQGCDPGHGSFGTTRAGTVDALAVQNALAEFEYAAQNIGFLQPDPNGGQGQRFISIIQATPLALAAAEIEQHKILYYLLREEARLLGAGVASEQLDDLLAQINVRTAEGSIVMYENIKNKPQGRYTRQTLNNVLSVAAAFNRARTDIKVTQPQRRADMAMQYQSISLRLVDFDAKAYESRVTPPTDEQLKAQFEQFADTIRGVGTREQNPFGFGYKYPDRVTLQYISVDPTQLRQAVLDNPQNGASPEDRAYYWEVEARKYYNQNKVLFPASQPATTQPATTQLAATRAAFESAPFDAVKQRAIDAIVQPQVERLTRQVQQRIVTAMSNDYNTFSRAATTAASTTTLGHAFNTFDYLKALAEDIQKQFGVMPTVVNLADRHRSAAELALLDGVRDATAMVQGSELPFGDYALRYAEALTAGSSEREQAFLLALYQPSQTLTDFGGAIYVFRLTGAEKSHKPATIEEVKDQVAADYRQKAAYDLALAEAKALVAAAEQSNLVTAAAGRAVIETEPLRFTRSQEFTQLPLSPLAFQNMMRQAFDLMAADGPNPRLVIELPREGRALAAELKELRGDIPEEILSLVESEVSNRVSSQLAQSMAVSWFNFYNVAHRLHYVEPGATAPATQPANAAR